MGWFKTEGGKNDDLLAVYKGPGHNGHFGAQYLQKSLVTFPWLHYLSAAGKFTGIILHHVQTQQSFKSQCRPGALDVPPIFALSDRCPPRGGAERARHPFWLLGAQASRKSDGRTGAGYGGS